MKVLMPVYRAGTGSDVYFENIQRALGEEIVKIEYHQGWSSIIPCIPEIKYESSGYDIVHTNVDNGSCFYEKDKPFIVVVHHVVFDRLYERYKGIMQRTYHELILRRQIMKSMKLADCVVTVSKFSADAIEREFSDAEAQVIYNGVDTRHFKPSGVQERMGKPFRVLFSGKSSIRKGADLLPKIMAELGEGYELVETRGDITYEQLPSAYNSCDALICPSRLEGFGLAVAEAMSCGRAVVASDYSSLPEIIDNEKGGFLVEVDDVKGFADSLRYLRDNPDVCVRMGRYNRSKAQRYYSLERMGEEYIKLYEENLR